MTGTDTRVADARHHPEHPADGAGGAKPTPPRGYQVAPWELTWCGLDVGQLKRTESTFALSNGHLGMRGTLEEGEPRGLPGTYLNGFYEEHPLPYAEGG